MGVGIVYLMLIGRKLLPDYPDESLAEDFNIEAKNIKIDKKNQISIFENDVVIKDKQNIIQSDFAKYDKQKNFIIVRKNIVLEDKIGNKFYGEYATFDKDKKII